jgi:hypothetical protein
MPNPFNYDITNQLSVGPQQVSNGARISQRGGRQGDGIVSDLWGKWGELASQGQVFAARVNTAAIIPIFSTSTNAPALWNPAGSGKWVVPIRIIIQPFAVGTPVFTSFSLQYLVNCGATAATAAPVLTFTTQAPVNMRLGTGLASTTLFSPAVSTYTTNPAQLQDLGLGHILEGTAATGMVYNTQYYDFDSTLILPPGALISIGGAVASGITYKSTFIFAEIPALV